jgi:hypothetical protein
VDNRLTLPDPTIPLREHWVQKNYPDGSLGDKAVLDYPYWRKIHYARIPPLTIIINPNPNEL